MKTLSAFSCYALIAATTLLTACQPIVYTGGGSPEYVPVEQQSQPAVNNNTTNNTTNNNTTNNTTNNQINRKNHQVARDAAKAGAVKKAIDNNNPPPPPPPPNPNEHQSQIAKGNILSKNQ